MPNPATPGTVLTFASTVLLALATFCTPLIKTLYLFKATINNGTVSGALTLGTLGYCISLADSRTCSSVNFGYNLDRDQIQSTTGIDIPKSISKWITYVLIVNFAAFCLAILSFSFGLIAHFGMYGMSVVAAIISGFGALVAMVGFVFDIVLFFVAKKRINSVPGASTSIGTATWLVLAGWICLMVSGCAFGFGQLCMSSRGPREPDDGMRGQRMYPDDAYNDQVRRDALQQEEDRKNRLANGDPNHLPGFQPYETIPLTSTGNSGQGRDQWLEEEEEEQDLGAGGNAAHLGYRDQVEESGFNAGRGAGGRGLDQGAAYGQPGALQRGESDSYAAGQASPGGYPSVAEADQDYYRAEPYADPYAQPYRSTSPLPNQFYSPTTSGSHYDPYLSPQQLNPARQASPAMLAPAPQRLADPQGNSYAGFLDAQHHMSNMASGSGSTSAEGITGPEPPSYELTATPGFSPSGQSGYRQEKSAFTGYH